MDDVQYSKMSWNKDLERWWLSQVQCRLLRSRLSGCHATLPRKEHPERRLRRRLGAVWMPLLSATGFMGKISWTFNEQHDKSKEENRVAPTSDEMLLTLFWLLAVRCKMLCNLESFMALNLLDAEFLHCSFLVSYLFLIHFVYFSSVRWKILLGFLCRNRLLLTGTPIQNSMAEVCPITLLEIFYAPPHACCLFSI